MAYDTRQTYLCYNNRDLIRDGYIPLSIQKEYKPVSTFNPNKLKTRRKGITYQVTRDEATQAITKVVETKKLLPATKLKVEIDFSKVMSNAVTHPFQPGSLPLTPIGQAIGSMIISPIGFGGLTSGVTEMTFQILDAETKINRRITVDEQLIKTGIWVCDDGYPLSVFGVVAEIRVQRDSDPSADGPDFVYFENTGLDFTAEQKEVLGKFSSGVWEGSARKRIVGATDSSGLFGGRAVAEVKFEDVAKPGQQQLFVKIVRDDRLVRFRADNYGEGKGLGEPPVLGGKFGTEAVDRGILIKTTDDDGNPLFSVGQYLYITYSVAKERRVRQNLVHKGTIAQGNTIGVVGFVGAISSEVEAFDYQICTWKVPSLPASLAASGRVDTFSEYNTSVHGSDVSSSYKLSVNEYYAAMAGSQGHEEITGWRLSESIVVKNPKVFWAADWRGIFLYSEFATRSSMFQVLPASAIRDKTWFTDYLKSLPFTTPTGPTDADGNPTYVLADLQVDFQYEDSDDQPGFLYDLSEPVNSLVFDSDKIPYYRPFAEALKKISPYNPSLGTSGVGCPMLDLLKSWVLGGDYLPSHEFVWSNPSLFDLSLASFRNANSQPTMSYPCDQAFQMYPYHYWSENYDAQNNGPGAWYDRGYIENQVFEWRPAGGTIESYWKVETPYFCGEFTKKTRVYMEKMGGTSLDNYSWIYVDTVPFVPYNISADKNFYTEQSALVFKDELVHDGLCYHFLNDTMTEAYLPSLVQDPTLSHIQSEFDHKTSIIVGQNRILGDYPSYSHGRPINDAITRICREGTADDFWWTQDLLFGMNPDGTSHGLRFTDDPPTATFPSTWYIRKLKIDFRYANGYDATGHPIIPNIPMEDQYVSFYFPDTDASVTNVVLHTSNVDTDTGIAHAEVDFHYYHGGTLQFLGNFWNHIDVVGVEARMASQEGSPQSSLALDFRDYQVLEGQNAVVFDAVGRLMVFYGNSQSGNIDVAISQDDGARWIVHKSIINLIENETASFPVVAKDYDDNFLHLFYVLNDEFIMYKRINTGLFWTEDAFVEPLVPTSYDVGDYDTAVSNPASAMWGEYTQWGHLLRQMPSYFVVGSASSPFFVEQNTIKNNLTTANASVTDATYKQPARFQYSGSLGDLNDAYNGTAFSVHVDDRGIVRLFYVSDGKLSVKRSDNYFMWYYEIEEAEIHRLYKDDSQNEGFSSDIQNIQVIQNDQDGVHVSLLYCNNEMLFVRHFDANLLFPTYDSSGNRDDTHTRNQLALTQNSHNRPIFLVGNMPAQLRSTKTAEIDASVSSEDSDLLIEVPYDRSMIPNFDERFGIDTETQPVGYTTKSGVIRIFYMDDLSHIRGILLDSLTKPSLEVMNKNRIP
jgi:hypothetical protein